MIDGYERWRSRSGYSKRHGLDPAAPALLASHVETHRVGYHASRARYPAWNFSVCEDRGLFSLVVFRAHPETGALQKLGPWPLPEDADEDQVRAAALAAVVEVDGEAARERFVWLPPK